MSYERQNYDIANPYELFSLNCGLMLRDKLKTEVSVKDSEGSDASAMHIVLHDPRETADAPQWEPLELVVHNSEGIQESYVLSLATVEKSISEEALTTYFYYLGKLIGQFTFYNLFHRTSELHFNEINYVKTKTYLEIMIRSFPAFSNKYMEMISDESEKTDPKVFNTCKMFLELNSSFLGDIDKIDHFTKYENTYVPVSTLLAMNYIALSYTIFGITLRIRNQSTFELGDFIKRGSEGMIDPILNTLVFGQNSDQDINIQKRKLDSLYYTFKVLSDFYLHGKEFCFDISENRTFKCFYNIGKSIEKYLMSDTATEGKDIIVEIVGNTIFNIEPNLMSFCKNSHWILPEKANFGIASECDNPIIYFETLHHFLFMAEIYTSRATEEKGEEISNLSSMICVESLYKKEMQLDQEISFKELKLFIENLLVTDSNIISPKLIFKLIYIAAFARIYMHDKSLISASKVKDGEYAYDVIIMAETAVYYLYQEWFNRKNKVYRYEKRIYSPKIDQKSNIMDPLKYESLISIVEYVKLLMGFKQENYMSAIGALNTSQFTELLHDEYHSYNKSFNSVKGYMDNISSILKAVSQTEEFGVDVMIDPVKGKLGVLFSLLCDPSKDLLIDLMSEKTTITSFFAQLESKGENQNAMVELLKKLKPNEEILGNSSDTEVYKVINTCVNEIYNSGLNNYQKFYLIYCLNYQFIKNNQLTMIASGMNDPNVLLINKEKTLNEERGIMSTLESIQYDLLRDKEVKLRKYGFDL